MKPFSFSLFSRLVCAALLCAHCLVAFPAAARAAESFRYTLAGQQEYGAKHGFRLGFEDNSTTLPRKRENLSLVLAVADGKAWRFLQFKTAWQWDHDYQIKADIGAQNTVLWVDGVRVKDAACVYSPARDLDVLKAGLDTRRDTGATEYLVHQTALRITTGKGHQKFAFVAPNARPVPLFALDAQTPVVAPFKTTDGENVSVETSFRLRQLPDIKTLAPFVDQWGQSTHANWKGKIRSEADFRQARDEEKKRNGAWGIPTGYDKYGGYRASDWHETATGFFRTTRRNGVWWLVSPDGNPCFYVGVDTVTGTSEKTGVTGREYLFENLPPQTGAFALAWGGEPDARTFGFTTANLIRKYGKTWENDSWLDAGQRLKTWGFSGVGKWSGIPQQISASACQVLRRRDVPTIGRMPDIFDPGVKATFRATLEAAITPNKNNPFLVGWSLGNEHDEIVLPTDIEAIFRKPGAVSARTALSAYALKTLYNGDAAKMATAWKVPAERLDSIDIQPPATDRETLRVYFAETYYDYVYRTVKELDPNHLYMGFWIGIGWWESEEDWRALARHCDVIGYDEYRFQFSDPRQDRLFKEAGKPVFCGEFSYPSWYNGSRGYGVYGTATASDGESGKRYASLVGEASRNPYCVGMLWFQYRDQPLTGRGAKGTGLVLDEHYAFGLVDIADRPKWDLIGPMRAANLAAAPARLEATKAGQK